MEKLHSYSKVWAFTHREASHLFDGPVVIQEKVDGSQFSFGSINGALYCHSKSQMIGLPETQKSMFSKAIRTAKLIYATGTISDGMCIRCEYLEKPKHNSLIYSTVPVGNLVIFDITLEDGTEKYLPPEEVNKWASKWGLQTVPLLYYGPMTEDEFKRHLKIWMDRESFLGGTKIEGVVIKNYNQCDTTGKLLCGKFVSAEFKELNHKNWKAQSKGSAIEQIIASFNKEAIWAKAVQHKREEGILLNAPQDIGMLIGEVKKDFGIEHGEAIKRKIFKEFYADIERGIMAGFPEWYKKKLIE